MAGRDVTCAKWWLTGSTTTEAVMNRNHRIRIRRLVGVLTGLAAALAAVVMGAPAAFAEQWPPPLLGVTARPVPAGFAQQYPYPYGGPLSRFGPVAHHFNRVTGGMTGWQVALIAVGAAIVGAIAALLVERARRARRGVLSAAA
jgi:hypothetical protein